ncbi:hypothetical protein XI25_08155 [Paenibacillus sp. DMB20]|nr:hypothetical protein XI25_08155 [Paenibacillus sp. DMB20]
MDKEFTYGQSNILVVALAGIPVNATYLFKGMAKMTGIVSYILAPDVIRRKQKKQLLVLQPHARYVI